MNSVAAQSLPSVWCIVPAAGIGSRMGASVPKQYLRLGQYSILEHTLQRLLALPGLAGLVLVLSPADMYWRESSLFGDQRIVCIEGGSERADSVLNALMFLQSKGAADDWVLVHDAARPCVSLASVEQLIAQVLERQAVGGILAVPVSDTLKRVADNSIAATVDRRNLWQAQTPQLFPNQLLRDCLSSALSAGYAVTDEASAVEYAGYQPLIVEGRSDNIKVTRPEDLALAAFILQQQAQTAL